MSSSRIIPINPQSIFFRIDLRGICCRRKKSLYLFHARDISGMGLLSDLIGPGKDADWARPGKVHMKNGPYMYVRYAKTHRNKFHEQMTFIDNHCVDPVLFKLLA